MMNGERKSPQIEVSRSASGELKSVTELLNTYKDDKILYGIECWGGYPSFARMTKSLAAPNEMRLVATNSCNSS
ncbi:MAG TPA: hypothetical protein VKH37_11930 [Ferruginibacter sp.]|nr:hypothetical protein [Ferruginibacter sp.]